MIPEYLERLRTERRLSPKTLELYAIELRTLERLGRELKVIREHLSGCASATHSRKLVIWRGYLNSIGDTFLDSLPMPRVQNKPVSFLNEDEEARLKSEIQSVGIEESLFVDIGLKLGLRISEILQIKSKNIEGDWIKITRKGGKEQYVPLTEDLVLRLKHFKGFQKGKDYYQILIKKVSKRAGIEKKVTPHILRHTFACRIIRQGVDVICLRDLLGHANVGTTSKYCHTTPNQLLKIVRG